MFSMKKQMEKLNIAIMKKKVQVFGIIGLCVYCAYSLFLNWSFVADSVGGSTRKPDFLGCLAGGRPVAYIMTWIEYIAYKLLHFDFDTRQQIYQLIVMILLSCVVYQLYGLFSQMFENQYHSLVLITVLLIGFINPYIVEAFVYKAIDYGVAMNLVCLAIRLFGRKRYFSSLVFLWMGVSLYQSYFALFLIYITAYLYMYYQGKLCKDVIFEAVKMFFITGFSVISNILWVKLFVALGIIEREVKVVDLADASAKSVFSDIWNAYYWAVIACYKEMFPPYFLITIILLLILFICMFLIKAKYHIIDIVYFILLAVAINLYPVVIFAVAAGVHQRITWPIFSSISALMLLLFYYTYADKIKQKLSLIMLAVFWIVNIFETSTAINDFYISNKLDMFIVAQVVQKIDHYEEETGEKIQYIATDRTENRKDCYDELNHSYDANFYGEKTISRSWSDVALIDYLAGRDYEKVPMDEKIYDTYFAEKKWDTFDVDEQIVFIGDTMYWAIY